MREQHFYIRGVFTHGSRHRLQPLSPFGVKVSAIAPDIGECHERDGVHRTSGRIFKIIYGEQDKGDLKNQPAFDIGSQSIDELIINLMHPNQWFARKARRRLQELASSNDSAITKTVQEDESGLVRLYLASSLNRMTTERAFQLSKALADHAEDADDSVQPHLLWFGIEPFVLQSPKAAVELVITSKIPLLSENTARRITGELDSSPELVEQLLESLSAETGGTTMLTRHRCDQTNSVVIDA